MIFVVAAIFILVVSFVIALISLIREQSKIEKAAADPSLGADQISVQEPQAVEKKVSGSELANLNFPQPQPQPQSQLQSQPQAPTQTQGEDLNAVNLAQKPWWEKEIQKRGEESQGSIIDRQDTSQPKPSPADVSETEESGKALESQDTFGAQAPGKNDQNLQGSFSLSDLKGADQES